MGHCVKLCLICVIVILRGGLLLSADDPPVLSLPGNTQLPESGVEYPAFASFDAMMRDFVHTHKVPGAALAVAKDGRLVYARGFGYADLGDRSAVEPDSLFRIAATMFGKVAAAGILTLSDVK